MRLRVNSLPRDRPRRLGIIRADFANAFTAPPLSAACEMRNEEADNKMAFSSKSEFRKACRHREAAMQFAVPRPQAVGWSPMRRRLVSPAAKSRLCFKWIRGSFEKCRKCFEIHAHCGICPTIRRKYGAASLIRTFPPVADSTQRRSWQLPEAVVHLPCNGPRHAIACRMASFAISLSSAASRGSIVLLLSFKSLPYPR